ncbi:hypothetical protein V8C43DRAFT_261950 [Trichoderma afarasin]
MSIIYLKRMCFLCLWSILNEGDVHSIIPYFLYFMRKKMLKRSACSLVPFTLLFERFDDKYHLCSVPIRQPYAGTSLILCRFFFLLYIFYRFFLENYFVGF